MRGLSIQRRQNGVLRKCPPPILRSGSGSASANRSSAKASRQSAACRFSDSRFSVAGLTITGRAACLSAAVRARRGRPVRADKPGRQVRPSPHRAQTAGAHGAHEPPETAAFEPFLQHPRTNVPYRPPCGAARQSRLPSRSAVCPDRVPSAAARAVCPPAERPALHRNLRPPSTRREPQAAGTVRRTRNRRLANALSADSLRQSRCAAYAHRGPRPAGSTASGRIPSGSRKRQYSTASVLFGLSKRTAACLLTLLSSSCRLAA